MRFIDFAIKGSDCTEEECRERHPLSPNVGNWVCVSLMVFTAKYDEKPLSAYKLEIKTDVLFLIAHF